MTGKEILATLVVAALAFVIADTAARWPNFNPDESRWISRAHYLTALADPFGPTWTDQYATRGQPPLGSYAMGLALMVQGRDLETNSPWNFSVPWEINIALGRKPISADLAAGRRLSAALVALTAVAVIGIACSFVTTPWAIAGGALFAIHPFTVYIGSLAMADALFGLLIALAAWAAAWFAGHPGPGRAIHTGVLLGLGGATKLSPLTVAAGLCAAGVLMGAIHAVRSRRLTSASKRLVIYSLLVGLAAVVTFVASYPYLWPDPVGRTRNLIEFRAEEMATQASDWPVMAVPTRLDALRRINVNFTERFSFTGTLDQALGGNTLLSLLSQLEFLVPVLGIAIMVGLAIRDGPYSPRSMVLAVLGGQVVVTILGMRSEFDRYHLPMALLGAVAGAVALEWLSRRAVSIWNAKSKRQPVETRGARA